MGTRGLWGFEQLGLLNNFLNIRTYKRHHRRPYWSSNLYWSSILGTQWRSLLILGTRLKTHFDPCKNSLVRKLGRAFFSPFMWVISKLKHDNKACHLAKLYFETRILTSFCKTLGAALQYVLIKNFLLKKSSWNFKIHKTVAKISFLTLEYFSWTECQIPKWYLIICSFEEFGKTCLRTSLYPKFEASVSTMRFAFGSEIPRHGRVLTILFIYCTILSCGYPKLENSFVIFGKKVDTLSWYWE